MLISCNSDVTGKRDFQKLKNDKSGYFAPCDDNHLYAVSFENHSIKKDTINNVMDNKYINFIWYSYSSYEKIISNLLLKGNIIC